MRVIEGAGLGRAVLTSRASAGAFRIRQLDALAKPWAPRPHPGPARALAAQLRPMVLCGQGSMGMPCQVPEVVSGGLGGLGASWWGSSAISTLACSELQAVLSPMGRALAEAKRVGVTSMAVKDAQEFYDKESSFWSGSNPWAPQSCRDVTNAGQVRLNALNAAIASAGGSPAAPPVEPGSGGPGEGGGLFGNWMSTVKTVAIAGAVIAGVVVVAPIVWELVASRRASRGR